MVDVVTFDWLIKVSFEFIFSSDMTHQWKHGLQTGTGAAADQASEVDRRQRQIQKLRESLQRGRLPYDRNLHQMDFGFETELSNVRRSIIDSLDTLKVGQSNKVTT